MIDDNHGACACVTSYGGQTLGTISLHVPRYVCAREHTSFARFMLVPVVDLV